jgi:hypothetical protein
MLKVTDHDLRSVKIYEFLCQLKICANDFFQLPRQHTAFFDQLNRTQLIQFDLASIFSISSNLSALPIWS